MLGRTPWQALTRRGARCRYLFLLFGLLGVNASLYVATSVMDPGERPPARPVTPLHADAIAAAPLHGSAPHKARAHGGREDVMAG